MRDRQVLVTDEFLHRQHCCSPHCQVRAERVAQDVNSAPHNERGTNAAVRDRRLPIPMRRSKSWNAASRRARLVVARHRLHNVSTTAVESRGLGWTAVNESKRPNRLCLKRLEPEVARHHQFRKTRLSEFESLPPSQLVPRDLSLGRTPVLAEPYSLPITLSARRPRSPQFLENTLQP